MSRLWNGRVEWFLVDREVWIAKDYWDRVSTVQYSMGTVWVSRAQYSTVWLKCGSVTHSTVQYGYSVGQ
jgi:hypothetical protein